MLEGQLTRQRATARPSRHRRDASIAEISYRQQQDADDILIRAHAYGRFRGLRHLLASAGKDLHTMRNSSPKSNDIT